MKWEQLAFPLVIAGSVASIAFFLRGNNTKATPVTNPSDLAPVQYFNFSGGTVSLPKIPTMQTYIPPNTVNPPVSLSAPDIVPHNTLTYSDVGNAQFANPHHGQLMFSQQ